MSSTYKVVALSVGKPKEIDFHNTKVNTAFQKQPINQSVYLSKQNFNGDKQADTKNHGGRDKAVLGYCAEHYTYWTDRTGKSFAPSSFGENLTVEGLSEDNICIGDTYQLDEAVIQVSQPRKPCYKIAARHGIKEFPQFFEETGYTGYYFRVLKEGVVSEQPQLKLIEKGTGDITLADINRILYKEKSIEGYRHIAQLPELAESLRKNLEKKIIRLSTK